MSDNLIEFTITVKELESALEFAKTNGEGRFNAITLSIGKSTGIGCGINVSNSNKSIDITDYKSW